MKRFLSLAVTLSFVAMPVVVLATSGGLMLPDPLGGSVSSFADLIRNITNYLSMIIGTVAVLMFVIAGIMFVTSAGNQSKIDAAKKTAIWAAIGVGVVLIGGGLIELVKVIINGTI